MKQAMYIHWPFCKAKCPYCDFNSHVRESIDQERWRRALLAELNYVAALRPVAPLTSIFFGGGTPSLMQPATVAAVIAEADRLFGLAPECEITLEANPTSVEAERFADLHAAGVNRVSLGIQSLCADSLRFLGREHSVAEARAAIDLAATHFPRTSFDLIYALPGQTLADWEEQLAEALPLAGDHLSLYQLTIEPGTHFYHAHRAGKFVMPDEALAADLFDHTQAVMTARGMPAYETSNHAAPGGESRHNLAYWEGWDYPAIGPGAHGRITIDGVRHATLAHRSPEAWLAAVEAQGHGLADFTPLTAQADIEERLLMGLRLTEGIDATRFHAQTGYDLFRLWPQAALQSLHAEGLLTPSTTHLRPTPKGHRLLTSLTQHLAERMVLPTMSLHS